MKFYVSGPNEGHPCNAGPLLRGKPVDLPFGAGCKVCAQPIETGVLVIFDPRRGWIHGVCKVKVFEA